MESVSECVRGCTVTVDDEQGLFIPAVAREGLLCARCLGRIGWLLDDVADTAARARLAVVPGVAASTGGGERVSGSREPGLPFNAQALEACDLIVGVLADWITYWARELGVAPPAALTAALQSDRNVAGVRAGTDPDAVAIGLQEWGWWLKRYLPEIARLRVVAEFHDELTEVVDKVGRQFPRGEVRQFGQLRARYCPVCEMRRVWVTWVGREPVVRCESCRWEFETDWGEFLEALGISNSGA